MPTKADLLSEEEKAFLREHDPLHLAHLHTLPADEKEPKKNDVKKRDSGFKLDDEKGFV